MQIVKLAYNDIKNFNKKFSGTDKNRPFLSHTHVSMEQDENGSPVLVLSCTDSFKAARLLFSLTDEQAEHLNAVVEPRKTIIDNNLLIAFCSVNGKKVVDVEGLLPFFTKSELLAPFFPDIFKNFYIAGEGAGSTAVNPVFLNAFSTWLKAAKVGNVVIFRGGTPQQIKPLHLSSDFTIPNKESIKCAFQGLIMGIRV